MYKSHILLYFCSITSFCLSIFKWRFLNGYLDLTNGMIRKCILICDLYQNQMRNEVRMKQRPKFFSKNKLEKRNVKRLVYLFDLQTTLVYTDTFSIFHAAGLTAQWQF
jgi:hypothetical protein